MCQEDGQVRHSTIKLPQTGFRIRVRPEVLGWNYSLMPVRHSLKAHFSLPKREPPLSSVIPVNVHEFADSMTDTKQRQKKKH